LRAAHQHHSLMDGMQIETRAYITEPRNYCPAGIYFANQSNARTSTSVRCSGCTKPCPSFGYTTNCVGTCSSRRACQNSNDCGAGHSPSRSPTTASVGVLILWMKLIAEL